MKKILSIALFLVLIYGSILPLPTASAAGIMFAADSNVQASRGGTVTVPIRVSNNAAPGFAAVVFEVSFNTHELVLQRVEATVDELPLNRFLLNSGQNTQRISLIDESNPRDWIGKDGDIIVNLIFRVQPDAALGTTAVTLEYSIPPANGAPASSTTRSLLSDAQRPGNGSVFISPSEEEIDDGGTGPYLVIFDPAGGTRTGGGQLAQTIPRGSNAVAPIVTRQGYTFNGWDRDFTNVRSNRTITALWTSGDGGNGGGASPSPGPGASPSPGPGASPSPGPGASPSPGPGTGAGGIQVITDFGTWMGRGTSTAKLDAEQSEFVRLMLGETVVSENSYTVTTGSTIITLKEGYLRSLADGTYRFRAEFTNDRYADLTLVVSSGPMFGKVPQTSAIDITWSVVIMWASIFLTVFLGVSLYFHLKEKRRSKIFDISRHGKQKNNTY